MEETSTTALDAEITAIRFGLASRQEICAASISDCSITHASQLSNPFLGLPLEFGRCESCGTSDPGKCEGHFGYIELPIPIYHPSHVSELKRMLSMLCLKCLKMRNNKFPIKNAGVGERLLASCCEDAAQVSIREVKTSEGAHCLQLKVSSRSRLRDGFWNFLERYGFRYGDNISRPLLPCEVVEILKRISEETKKKLAGKGYFPQDGYIIQYLPVPPNCLSVPEVSDGVSVMSSDLSVTMLRKVLRQVEIIKGSRSGTPNFESHDVEAQDLQIVVNEYLLVRGTAKASRDIDTRYGIGKEPSDTATKAWLEKMRTLFIRKGSGFSSRSVITGDAFKKVNEIGIPTEIAQRITFEEKVSIYNMNYLQSLVDKKLCLAYKDGSAMYSLSEGSKGHTSLKPGQVVHRRIMDGDIVFINRPPTTHKHSLQALSVYVHDDHTVKINPLICGPLGADFDGDCVHLFYPQSAPAKAEVVELFSVEKQLLSSHSGNLNLQLATDSLLSLKMMFKKYFYGKLAAQQLAMFVSLDLPYPALLKAHQFCPTWTALQMLQTALPAGFNCCGDKYLINRSDLLEVDYSRDFTASMISEIVTSIFFEKSPVEVLKFFDALQPLLMENLFTEGFSVCLEDFYIPQSMIQDIQKNIQVISPLLYHLRTAHNELLQLQLENHLRLTKLPLSRFILRSSALGDLVDSKSDSAISKIIQQIGFLGVQISDKGKFYSTSLFDEMASLFRSKYFSEGVDYPSGEYGLIKSSFICGLDPYEMMVHSICTREVIVRSTRGLSEPGTLFKNLMAILRDVVICYDGTVRNVCSNSIIQFEYGSEVGGKPENLFPAGEPVGVLAATAMSNPAYKAVLDSSPSSNSSWELMKEILQCRVNFRNEPIDRRVILYLNRCGCGRKHCSENAACLVKSHLKKVSLKDLTVDFMIEYKELRTVLESSEAHAGLVGHIHLNEVLLKELNIPMVDVLKQCQETINSFRKKKKVGNLFKGTVLSVSDSCSFQPLCVGGKSQMPCLMFSSLDANDPQLEKITHVLANKICPVILDTIIKGDPRISSVNIVWINPDTTSWIRNSRRNQKGELALDIVLEKSVCKRSGDAWRIALDSCLPILHLIDTKRSIPYAIKQVEELLGISCAFDQAIQRLSTSVAMVAKGVLKEHLMLLADSMTCSGSLIGFNSAGYKAFSRSLNVQVPFTEATLFTPRKCFERASVKCHVDALSSVVASCSWGKCVAVGTGSKFDILWGTKDGVDSKQEGATEVYSFLHMVRGPNMEGRGDSTCLGVEIEHLDWEEENAELNRSPENNSERPVFEDNVEFPDNVDVQPNGWNWDKVTSADNGSSGWDASASWEKNDNDSTTPGNNRQSTAWSNWGSKKAESQVIGSQVDDQKSSWNNLASWDKEADSNRLGGHKSKDPSWGNGRTDGDDLHSTKVNENSSNSGGWGAAAWGSDGGSQSRKSWDGSEKSIIDETQRSKLEQQSHGWEATSWGKKPDDEMGWGGAQSVKDKTGRAGLDDSTKANEQPSISGGWDAVVGAMNEVGSQSEKGWNSSQTAETEKQSQWETAGWGKRAEGSEVSQGGWNSSQNADDTSKKVYEDGSQLGKRWNISQSPKAKESDKQSQWEATGWGQKADDGDMSQRGWNTSKSVDDMSGRVDADVLHSTRPNEPSSTSGGWGTVASGQSEGSSQIGKGWNTQNSKAEGTEKSSQWERQSQWGGDSKKKSKGQHPEWKMRRSLSRPREMTYEDPAAPRMFTATRQRLDMFTSEEQDILTDVEPIMQSIRRIMHLSGYNDNDPLSAEDQSYIIDNVLNHHPDKAAKIGAGIEHLTVSRHSSFPESRCFYVVSTDGSRIDFSYRKCLENFVKTKYPDAADLFIGKYFRRPRSEGKREQSVAPEEPAENR
ncbi:DNA-directed RNA polymerase V subunit 1 [Syzygium oleosum]|uniref:DNA-directed RNA polymerase V subunit 1 n=1 Tax=Syzygium oleosum TaxID=219896 RepID=UPI0011D1EF1A|nr:DNA-directed RNA polymerase V subunit 1 [Syzygium oleosum]